MIKRHAPSFFFSVLVHVLAVLIFFSTYKYINILTAKKKEQKRVCLQLSLCIPEMKEIVKKQVEPLKQVKKISEPKKIIKQSFVEKADKKKPVKKNVKPSLEIPIVTQKLEEKPREEIVQEEIAGEEIQELETEKEEKKEEASSENQTNELKIIKESFAEEILPVEKIDSNKKNEEKYVNKNIQIISQLLSDNLYYPRSARKRGITGSVVVKFHLSIDAIVSNVEIISSKSEILSNAAIKTIEDLSGEFPKPEEELILQIPIEYTLTQK